MHLWGDGMSLGLVYKNGEHIFDEVCGEVPFLTYPLFEKTGVVKSAFSTRIGGVSKGCYESMNLSFDSHSPRAIIPSLLPSSFSS